MRTGSGIRKTKRFVFRINEKGAVPEKIRKKQLIGAAPGIGGRSNKIHYIYTVNRLFLQKIIYEIR